MATATCLKNEHFVEQIPPLMRLRSRRLAAPIEGAGAAIGKFPSVLALHTAKSPLNRSILLVTGIQSLELGDDSNSVANKNQD